MALGASCLLLAGCQAAGTKPPVTGLMTSLPIVWGEQPDIGSMLREAQSAPHWARTELEKRDGLVLVDRIAPDTMKTVGLAVLIQPRALGPDEFVALDRWVRKGGRLLLFADPMLHVHSNFPLGDKRRPQAIAMVDPLLAHWGLELDFDEDQAEGEISVVAAGLSLLVEMPGTLAAKGKTCLVGSDRLVAQCRIGKGRAVIIADADMFDEPFDNPQAERVSALKGLLRLVDNHP